LRRGSMRSWGFVRRRSGMRRGSRMHGLRTSRWYIPAADSTPASATFAVFLSVPGSCGH
jgi:hypothetical protein